MSKTKSSTRFLALLMSVLMIFSLFPASALAANGETGEIVTETPAEETPSEGTQTEEVPAEEPLPEISSAEPAQLLQSEGNVFAVIHDGTTAEYADMDTVYDDLADGDTLKLLQDYTGEIYFEKSYTLDLNGHTVDNSSVTLSVPTTYTVTVISSVAGGKIYTEGSPAIEADSQATVMIGENVTVTTKSRSGKAFTSANDATGVKLVVNGGTLERAVKANIVEISDGIFNSTVGATDSMTITGGIFKSAVNGQNATSISGGTFKRKFSVDR